MGVALDSPSAHQAVPSLAHIETLRSRERDLDVHEAATQEGPHVEEITGSDIGNDSELEIIGPDEVEEAETAEERIKRKDSDEHGDDEAALLDRFRKLRCESNFGRVAQGRTSKKKRWSSGVLKRTYSQSNSGIDTEVESDVLYGYNMDCRSRRLRPRLGEFDDESSPFLAGSPEQGPPHMQDLEAVLSSTSVQLQSDEDLDVDSANGKISISIESSGSMDVDSDKNI